MLLLFFFEKGVGLTVRKYNAQLEQSTFPDRLLLARHAAFPHLEVEYALLVLDRFGEEAEGMIFAPLFSEGRGKACQFH